MTQYLIRLLLLCCSAGVLAQESIQKSLDHDEMERSFLLYVPDTYSSEEAAPLVFNFHGYTSNAYDQMHYGDFRSIADTAGFILVHPQGTKLDGKTHWNVGGWTMASTTDDVGFTKAMIEAISKEYNIDQERIYATGMSNGGYMSFLLACQLSERMAAVASVTGSMTPQTFNSCQPKHPIPILQIHGTADEVVPYQGLIWTQSIKQVLDYWTEFNNCTIKSETYTLPDRDPEDGSTVSKSQYNVCDNGALVTHYKVNGGGHTWPGNGKKKKGTNNDFNAAQTIWEFFSEFNIHGRIEK